MSKIKAERTGDAMRIDLSLAEIEQRPRVK